LDVFDLKEGGVFLSVALGTAETEDLSLGVQTVGLENKLGCRQRVNINKNVIHGSVKQRERSTSEAAFFLQHLSGSCFWHNLQPCLLIRSPTNTQFQRKSVMEVHLIRTESNQSVLLTICRF
jgi:hypothetical protein